MEENNNLGFGKKKAVLSQIILLVLMGSGIILLPLLGTKSAEPSWFYYVFATVLACGSALYGLFYEPQMSEGLLFWLVPVLYLISVGMMLVTDQPMNLPLWSFGGIFLISVYGLRTGMFWNFFLFFLAGSVQMTVSAESVWIQMFSMLLIGFFLPRKGTWQQYARFLLCYGAAVILSRLFFYFCFRSNIKDGNVFLIYLVYLVLISGCYLFSLLMREEVPKAEEPETPDIFVMIDEREQETGTDFATAREEAVSDAIHDAVTEQDVAAAVLEEAVSEEKERQEIALETETEKIKRLCSEEAPLLELLQKKSPESYRHCVRVAQCAATATKQLPNTDTELVFAGGLYHEIGRLEGKNTVENALTVAQREELPESLVNMISCAAGKWDKPYDKETAILMLVDNVCSMIEYLKKTQEGKVLISRVIDKTITLRVNNGELNESGLTVAELSVLRNILADSIKEEMF